jgi:hypothetical protein
VRGLGDLATQNAADLSDSVELVFTASGTVAINGYLNAGGVVGSDTLGPKLPWAAQLVAAMAWKNDALFASQLDIRAGASVKASVSFLAAETAVNSNGIAQQFAAGDVVNVKVAAILTGGGGIVLQFRRRTGL